MSNRPLSHQPFFWDILIVTSFIGSLLIAHYFLRSVGGSIGITGAVVFGIGALLIAYGSFIEPHLLRLNKKSVRILGLPPIKIAIVGDMHVGPYRGRKHLERIVGYLHASSPDIILIPGDFIYDHLSLLDDLDPLVHLKAPLGVYAVMGNHDSGHHLRHALFKMGTPFRLPDQTAAITEKLQSLGITVLRNASKNLTVNGKRFAVAGTDDVWMETHNLTQALTGIPDDVPVILLTHNPDIILHKGHERASLIVCGHTHGGQVRFPFIGAVHSIPAKVGKKYQQGIFALSGKTTLAITHGVGETQARARLFCRPEILLLENR